MQGLKARSLIALEALVIFALVMAVFYPLTPAKRLMPSRDSGVFLYVGWRILHGELPYLDVWDHKPPVIYYIDALGLALGQGSRWGVWAIEVLFLFAATALLYALMKRILGFFPALLASFFWIFTLMYMLTGGNITEEYALVMQAGGLFLFFLAERDGKYARWGFFIGLLAGLTFFTRQTSVGVFVAIGVYLLVARLWQREFHRLIQDLLPILAGGLLVVGGVVLYFASHGALERFWDNAFAYNFVYIDERDSGDRFAALLKGMDLFANVGLAPLAMFGWAFTLMRLLFIQSKQTPAPLRAFLWMLVIALPVEIALATVGGRPRAPYFIAWLPVFAVFGGISLVILFDALKQYELPKITGAITTFVLIVTLCAVLYNDYLDINRAGTDNQQNLALLAYINQNVKPEEGLLMWGAETGYNFASKRRSPTRFVYQYDLYKLVNEKNTIEFLNDLVNDRPKLIILKSYDQRITDIHFAYRSQETGRLIDLVRNAYIEVKVPQVKDWIIYQLEGTP